MKECLGSEWGNFFSFIRWRMILMGSKGTQFQLHFDSVATASWQAHLKGRKRWFLCDPEQSPYLYANHVGMTDLDPFAPDLETFPRFVDADCIDYVAQPGEVLYYPPKWWHSTYLLDDEVVGLAGRQIHAACLAGAMDEFRASCREGGEVSRLRRGLPGTRDRGRRARWRAHGEIGGHGRARARVGRESAAGDSVTCCPRRRRRERPRATHG